MLVYSLSVYLSVGLSNNLLHIFQAAVAKWANFALWNTLFFTNPNLGHGGSSVDTISESDSESPEGQAASHSASTSRVMSDHLDDTPNPLDGLDSSDEESLVAGPPSTVPSVLSTAISPSTSTLPNLSQKPSSDKQVSRRKKAQQEYVSAVTDVQVQLAELEQKTRLRELELDAARAKEQREFEDRRSREQRDWQEAFEERRQRYEDERERRREQHEIRMERERQDREERRESERMERESRLRMQEMRFQYELFNKESKGQ